MAYFHYPVQLQLHKQGVKCEWDEVTGDTNIGTCFDEFFKNLFSSGNRPGCPGRMEVK